MGPLNRLLYAVLSLLAVQAITATTRRISGSARA